MVAGNWLKKKLELFKDDFDFRLETLILNITERICKRMEQKKINRTELADLLNVSPPAVTKILNGNSNFTLKTLLSLADVLEQELEINFGDKKVVYTTAFEVVSEIGNITTAYSDEAIPLGDFYLPASSHSPLGGFQIQGKKEWVWVEAA